MFLSYSIIHLSGYVGENQRLTGGRAKSEASDGDLKIKLPPFAICRQYLCRFSPFRPSVFRLAIIIRSRCRVAQSSGEMGIGFNRILPDTRFLSRTVRVKRTDSRNLQIMRPNLRPKMYLYSPVLKFENYLFDRMEI